MRPTVPTVPYVVLDSTELTRDWLLRGLAFRVLAHLVEHHVVRVAVPAVVLLETRANHARGLAELDLQQARIDRARERLAESPRPAPDPSEPYEGRLDEVLESLGFDVLPWPTATHAQLAAAAVERRPPFDSVGSGYRDALVWRSALDLAVLPGQVGQAGDGRDLAYRGVGPVMVVLV